MKRREMSCSRAPRVFAGRRLSLLLFCRLAFLSLASPLLPQCPSFTRSEIGETGAAGQRSRRICDACRVTVLLWVENWGEGARGERERANRWDGEDCGSAVVRLILWKGVECSADRHKLCSHLRSICAPPALDGCLRSGYCCLLSPPTQRSHSMGTIW